MAADTGRAARSIDQTNPWYNSIVAPEFQIGLFVRAHHADRIPCDEMSPTANCALRTHRLSN